jgi:hypothetical protein
LERLFQEHAMHGRACVFILAAALSALSHDVLAQSTLQPAPRPLVTAENEGWYLAGEPITFAGNFYYPAGPQVFFNGNEMVRSGFYLGIPLYSRTTAEPYSVVYVPLSGGLMQPYERRRAGDVAGTVGSTAPEYPVRLAAEQRGDVSAGPAGIAQAAAPPTEPPFSNAPATATRANVVMPPFPELARAAAVGTIGNTAARQPAAPARSRTAVKPKGVNGVFIEYEHRRWFNSGPAVLLDLGRYTRVGDYRGFDVYQEHGPRTDTIYVQLAHGVPSFATPYTLRR